MWKKLKELVNSKKTILMVVAIVGAICCAATDIITAREAFAAICSAVGLNAASIGLQDFGKAAKAIVDVVKEDVKVEADEAK